MVVSELEVHDVQPGLGRPVGDVQRAILVILALDLRLAGPLDREGESAVPGSRDRQTQDRLELEKRPFMFVTLPRLPGVYVEEVVLVRPPLLESATGGANLAGVSNVARTHLGSEWIV